MSQSQDGPLSPPRNGETLPEVSPSSSPTDLSAGLPERYQVRGRVGQGGMGEVLSGSDVELGRDLALKLLLAERAMNPEAVERFREEARIGGQLQHPGIVPLYDLGNLGDGRPFFTMKLVKGQTLAKLLKDRSDSTQDRPRYLKVFEQISQTVAYAHTRGVIHRDLKPSNIMVGGYGEVLVMDWGLAKVLAGEETPPSQLSGEPVALKEDSSPQDTCSVIRVARTDSAMDTQEGDVMGTPAYMPPEQARGEVHRLDQRCDVFSLGGILCEVLTGFPPHTGSDGRAVMRKAQRGELTEALARLDSCEADAELISLAKCCLSVDRDARPRDAGVVAKAVEGYLASVEERARQAELERAAAEVRAAGERRARRLTLGLAAAVLLLVVGSGSGAWLVHQHRAEVAARQQRLDDQAAQQLSQARTLLNQAWNAANERGLTNSLTLAQRALDGEVSDAIRTEAGTLIEEIRRKIERAQHNARFLVALLEVKQPRDLDSYRYDTSGVMVLVQFSPEENYARAFRSWGVDVDQQPLDELARRLGEQPQAVVDQIIAALEDWFRHRLRLKAEEKRWRTLLELANALDDTPSRRELRRLRSEGRLRMHRDQLLALSRNLNPVSESVLEVLTLTDALLEAGEDREAERVLRKVLVERPGEVVLLTTLGSLLGTQRPQRLAEAAECYRAARAVNPRLGAVFASLLLCLNKSEEAERILRKLGAGQRSHPFLSCLLGSALYMQNKLSEAEASFREAIELEPSSAQAHLLLGGTFLKQKKLTEAETSFHKAIELKNDLAEAHLALGVVLHQRGKLKETELACRKAIKHKPDFATAHCTLGQALFEQMKIREAEASCRKAVELQPGFAQAHAVLGAALYAQMRLPAAELACRKAIELQSDLAEAHANLGLALLFQNKLQEAEVACHKAVELKPDSGMAQFALGTALLRQKKLPEAEIACRRAVELMPGEAGTHYSLGLALLGLRKYQEAATHSRKAVELQPDFALAYINLGTALRHQKKHREAEAASREAIKLQPDSGLGYNNLGLALRDQKKLTEAVTAFRKGNQLLPNDSTIGNNLRQTERLLDLSRRLPDILAGKSKPANPQEQAEFGKFCLSYEQRTYTAVRFYADVFRAEPTLADNPQHRYNAACAAVLAGSGKGVDAAGLGDKELTELRQQGLDWLRGELAATAKLLEKSTPALKQSVNQRLSHWLQDADLSSVRDATILAALPEAERTAWKKHWADVIDLLKKTEGKD